MYRKAKLVPWYHETRDPCEAVTHKEDQCIFSATYDGYPPTGPPVKLCTVHAQMATFPVKLIEPKIVQVREG